MSTSDAGGTAAALAEAAYGLVQVEPRRALELATRAWEAAGREGPEEQIAALHALAWAQHVLGDPAAATTARHGVRLAQRYGDRRGEGLLRRRLALTLAFSGKPRAAQHEIDAAMSLLTGVERARSEVHRLGVHLYVRAADPGVQRRVCADAARALRLLHREADEIWEARLLFNRGLLFADQGALSRATADLARAHTLYTRLGADAAAFDAAAMLAKLTLLQGDVVGCLRRVAQLEAVSPTGLNANLRECQIAALVQARLLPEARAAAEAYVDLCARTGRADFIATALLDLAAIATLSGDGAAATAYAQRSARSLAARGKLVNAALARTARVRARLLEGSVGPSSMRAVLDAAAVLDRAGWRLDAYRTRVLAARVALARRSPRTAARELDRARPLRRHGTVVDRVELLHALALLRIAEGDQAGGESLLREALELLHAHRLALGAFELRATSSGIGTEVALTGLRLAVASRRPARILAWAERARAAAVRLPAVAPPDDRALRALQSELRLVALRLREGEEKGTAQRGAASAQIRLERAIRTRMRLVEGDDQPQLGVSRPSDAARALGERALVEYVELDGRIGALTLVAGRLDFHELESRAATEELDWLRFALARAARGGDPAQRAAARGSAEASAAALDQRLVQPLTAAIGNRPLVVVPTGELHGLPWGVLPSLRGRPLVVAPSLAVWLGLAGLPRSRRRRTALVAGPRLRHSTREVSELASLLPAATVLTGKQATAKAALAALEGAALAHVACHGRFRGDSPLFSSLELADGPLNVYELQGLRRAPELVVLSACDLALSDRHPGDELLGLASALLGMGARTIVASVAPVSDATAKRVMLAFHRNLAAGDGAAAALAKAQAGSATASFVCLGVG